MGNKRREVPKEESVLDLIQRKEVHENILSLTVADLKVLVRWKFSGQHVPSKKVGLQKAWNEWKDKPVNNSIDWTTPANEARQLLRLKSDDIGLDDTEVGRVKSDLVQQVNASVDNLTDARVQEIQAAIASRR